MQPNTKMSSGQATFDLKAARKHADADGLMGTTKWLYAACDEVERLQNREKWLLEDNEKRAVAQKEQATRISELEESNKYLSDRGGGQATTIVEMQARMAKLEEAYQKIQSDTGWALLGARNVSEKHERKIAKQRAALKKLGQAKRERGKALVEERARRICHVPGDPVGHWARYEKVVVDEAREQLVHEGKL